MPVQSKQQDIDNSATICCGVLTANLVANWDDHIFYTCAQLVQRSIVQKVIHQNTFKLGLRSPLLQHFLFEETTQLHCLGLEAANAPGFR
jgi:hypothetical protein